MESYIFFDIDGTIYDYYKGIPDSTKLAVRLLREKGHHPVICTGRTRVMIFDEIISLGFDGIVAGGGTYIEWNGRVIHEEELPLSELKRLIGCLREHGFIPYPEGNHYFYYDPTHEDIEKEEIYRLYQMHIPEKLAPINLEDMHASKVSSRYTPKADARAVIELVKDDYIYVEHDDGSLFELIPKDASKGTGVRRLMDYLGEDMENTCGFGDSFNDLDMLKTVKRGVVMGNGNEELKKLIPLHTEGMYEDGVFNALRRFKLI